LNLSFVMIGGFCVGVYSFCDGPKLSRGPYLGVTMLCSVMSLIFVCFKVICLFSYDTSVGERELLRYDRGSQITLFVWSCSLAVAHVVVAYRTSCRERKKLLVYKIDIEGVRACSSSYFISLHDKTEKEENDICLFSCKWLTYLCITWFYWRKFQNGFLSLLIEFNYFLKVEFNFDPWKCYVIICNSICFN